MEQVQLKGDRLQYKLLSGDGPVEGWVSVALNGKPLAVQQQGPETSLPSNPWTTWRPLEAKRWAKFPRFGDGGRPTTMGAFKKASGDCHGIA